MTITKVEFQSARPHIKQVDGFPDFINKIDTGDWEYSVTRQKLINMFNRILLGPEPNQTTQTI